MKEKESTSQFLSWKYYYLSKFYYIFPVAES